MFRIVAAGGLSAGSLELPLRNTNGSAWARTAAAPQPSQAAARAARAATPRIGGNRRRIGRFLSGTGPFGDTGRRPARGRADSVARWLVEAVVGGLLVERGGPGHLAAQP